MSTRSNAALAFGEGRPAPLPLVGFQARRTTSWGCAGDPEHHARRAGRVIRLHWKSGDLPPTTHFEKP